MEKIIHQITKHYYGKKVLVTGHTGFKGAWLSTLLLHLGANVYGIALDDKTPLSNYILNSNTITSYVQDICDKKALDRTLVDIQPDIVFHLAAQALVLEGYNDPLTTFNTNFMGTVTLMESCRSLQNLQALVMITTDKVYHNNEWHFPYREIDALGGYDPYSASKAACEIAIASYAHSFFKDTVGITSVRAGNVIGGCDFAENRIIPDLVRSIQNNTSLEVRSPNSIRPWQYVLDALWGYIIIGNTLLQNKKTPSPSYNIAPTDTSYIHTVEYVVTQFIRAIGSGLFHKQNANTPHEMSRLQLDPSLIQAELLWAPLLSTEEAIQQTALEYKYFLENPNSVHELLNASTTTYLKKRLSL